MRDAWVDRLRRARLAEIGWTSGNGKTYVGQPARSINRAEPGPRGGDTSAPKTAPSAPPPYLPRLRSPTLVWLHEIQNSTTKKYLTVRSQRTATPSTTPLRLPLAFLPTPQAARCFDPKFNTIVYLLIFRRLFLRERVDDASTVRLGDQY